MGTITYYNTISLYSAVLLAGFSLLPEKSRAESAQPATSTKHSSIDEIVVTATKEGQQNLQQIPMAITAYNNEKLKTIGADNIEDLVEFTPGLNISRNGQAARLYIRGIGTNLDFIGADPSVTVHVDGIYQSRPTTALENFLDVERVEILKGPQGTLYGRNSTGGTINIISKLPEPQKKVHASLELGNFNHTNVSASASGRLSSDNVLGGIAFMKTDHDPYVENINDDSVDGLFDDDSFNTRASLRMLIDEDMELIVRSNYSKIDRLPDAYKATGLDTVGAPSLLAEALEQPDDPFKINISYPSPFVKQENKGASFELKYRLNEQVSLTSLTGYIDLSDHAIEDTDGSNLDVLVTEVDDHQSSISEELRVNYSDNLFNFVGGMFFLLDEHQSSIVINSISAFDSDNKTSAYALFANGRYALSDQLNLTLGLRFSQEEKAFNELRLLGDTLLFSVDETKSWNSWSPKLALDYQANHSTLFYASINRGFKSGGFNFTSSDGQFDPEYVTAYEGGIKKDWQEYDVRSNLALFYYDYSDMQVLDFLVPGVANMSNAAEAEIQGIEFESSWTPSFDWLFEFNFAFLHAQYKEYMAPAGAQKVDVSGNRLNASPEKKLNLAVQYFQHLPSGELSYRLEYAWQSEEFFTPFNEETSSQDSYGLVNGRVSFANEAAKWEFYLFGENLTNEAYSSSSREFPAASVGVTKDINPPRTYGVKFIYHFF